MSSVSASFTVFAATESVISALATALKSDTVKNLSSYTETTNTSSGSGSNVVKTNTSTVTLSTYAQYTEMADILEKLDAAIKDSDQYTKYGAFANDGSSRNCTDAGQIREEIQQSLLDSGDITAEEYAEYNISTFLDCVLSMQQVTYTHGNNTSTKNNVPASVYDITVIKTSDYQGYLAEKSSLAEVEDSIVLGKTYTVTMSRENYQTGSFIKTNHYHTVINTANGVPTIEDTEANTEVKPTLTAYNDYLDTVDFTLSYEDMLDMVLDGTMESFYNEFKDKYDAIVDYVGGTDTFNKLFSDSASAVDNMLKSCASAMDVEAYLAIAEQWKAFAENNPDYGVYNYGAFDYDEMTKAYNDFVQIYNQLAEGGEELLTYLNKHGNISLEYYNNFTDNIAVYTLAETAEAADALYNESKDTSAMSADEKTAAYSALTGYIDAIETYSEQVVSTIYPDGYAYLTSLAEELYCETNEFVAYFAEALGTVYADKTTETIENKIDEIPENLDGLHEFYSSLEASLGESRANELIGALLSDAEKLSDSLLALLAARFESEVTYADSVYKALGEPTELNAKTFIKLKAAFSGLEADIIDYLASKDASALISEETISVYNALLDKIYAGYLEFGATYGFSAYEQTTLQYASREVYPNDKVKTEAYDVTDESLLNIIDKLDEFLTGDTFTDLIGGKDLKTVLSDAVSGMIYSDSFINTCVELLYPLVLNEFLKVWDTLPMTVEYSGMNVAVNYKKDLYTILHEGDLNIYPQLLGEMLAEEYPEAGNALIEANRNWESAAIYDKNSGSLTLSWGVDDAPETEKEDAFYNAFAAALSGLKPLAMALLCNREWDANSSDIAAGSVNLGFTVTFNVALNLHATGNNGYANAIAPIFESLGCENIPTAEEVENYTDLTDVAKAIFEPIFSLIDKIGEQPVDTVLSMLPNLVYALSFDMVTPILSMLKTSISYTASINLLGNDISVLNDKVDVDVGEMLDLEDLGIDLSKGVNGLIGLLGIEIPEIDEATVATLGTLTTKDTVRRDWVYDNSAIGDKAYTIEADKAGLAYYILTYVVDLINDSDALTALLSSFLDESQISSVMSVLDMLDIKSTGDAIAAVTELLNAEKYPEAEFIYPEYEDTDSAETIVSDESSFYSIYWTRGQAKYVADNLVPFVENLLDLFGMDISGEIGDLVSSLYTSANIASITSLIGNAVSSLIEDETVTQIIEIADPLVNIDISALLKALREYTAPEFADGDEEAFKNALIDYVTPLVPVLKLLLLGDSELVIGEGLVTAYGYNGYDSAVVPILEALGCKTSSITKYDEFKTLGDRDMVSAVINPIFELIDETIADDPINNIIALLPNILYFIDNGSLQQSVDNLLRPVYVLLDVVRPIADIDLTVNLNLEEILTDALSSLVSGLSIKFPGYSELSSMLKSLGTVTQYESASGKTATRLTVEAPLTPEFITTLLRTLVKTVIFSTNAESIIAFIRENSGFSDEAKDEIESMILTWTELKNPDKVLFVLFYTFFGLNTGVNAAIDLRTLIAGEILDAFESIGLYSSQEFKDFVSTAADVLLEITGSADTVLGQGETKPITSFFRQIFDFFIKIINKILAIFKL